MTAYEAFQKNIIANRMGGISFREINPEELDSDEDKHLYALVIKVSQISVVITKDRIKFGPRIDWGEGHSFGPQDITDSDYDLLQGMDLTQLPLLMQAELGDLLWTYKKNHKAAMVAVNAYMQLFKSENAEEYGIIPLHMIYRMVDIAVRCNNKELLNTVCEEVYNLAIMDCDASQYVFTLGLIEILLEHKYGNPKAMQEVLEKIIRDPLTYGNLAEDAFRLKIKCLRFGKEKEEVIKEADLSFAQFYEDAYSKITPNNCRDINIAIEYLLNAAEIYDRNGKTEKAGQLKAIAMKLQEKIPECMHPFQKGYDVSDLMDYLEGFFDRLTFEESVIRLTQFVPFWKKGDIKNEILQRYRNPSFLDLVSKDFVNEYGQKVARLSPLNAHHPESDEELLDEHIHYYLFEEETHIGNLWLRRILDIIRNKHSILSEDMKFIIKNNGLIPEGRENIFQSGLYMAFNGQYYEAVHILAPQMENLFRCMLKDLEVSTLRFEKDGTSEEKSLGSIMDGLAKLDAYDKDILFIFKGLLNSPYGANIRNYVAHGMTSENSAKSGAYIYFLCAVIKFLCFTSPEYLKLYSTDEKIKELPSLQKDITPRRLDRKEIG